MSRTVCFNCGQPATAQVSNTKPPQHTKRICTAKVCWDKWYKEFGH